MKIPDIPINEPARLTALRSFQVLDTKPEERFDRITRIAKRAFRVPIALISLIDAERQWFKSCQGLYACETSRDISFCGHAILGDNLFVVPNALEDPRFCDNPLVIGAPHIRFYAGFPLTVVDGYRLGTLCIIDQVPRTLDAEEKLLMRDLGILAQQELASGKSRFLEDLKHRNEEMRFLSHLSDFLQASLSISEAFSIITNLVEPMFPHCSGGVFTICASRNRVEQRATWGQHLSSAKEFSPHGCWALRRGRSHQVNPERLGLRCNHVAAGQAIAATMCIPMIAQGETLGLFFLSTPDPEALSEAKQQLARTVAEQIALAIANLHLRETLQHRSQRDLLNYSPASISSSDQ